MVSSEIVIQVLVWGLVLGCIYALAASGFSLIFGVTKVINLAHGQLIMLGGYASYWIVYSLKLNPYLIIPVAMLVSGVVGLIFYYLCFRRIIGAEKLREAFLAIGLVYIIENLAVFFWKEDTRIILSPYREISLKTEILNMGLDQALIIIVTMAIFVFFSFFIAKMNLGKILRAVSQNREAAAMVGINLSKIDALTFMLSGFLAGIGGVLLGIILYLNPYMGFGLTIIAFTIVVFGGMGSMMGAVVGALIFGIVQQFTVFFWGGEWSYTVAFALLLIILMLKPQGLFGKAA